MIGQFIARNKDLLLKLLAALFAFGVGVTLFALIADEVLDGETSTFDSSILLWINARASSALDTFFIAFTDIGGFKFIVIVTAIIVAYMIYKKLYYKALLMLAAVGGAGVLNIILKGVFERTRPDLWQHLVTETDFSFPSGHAMASSIFTFALIAVLWGSKWQPLAVGLGIIYVFFIGFSRLYLGVHFPTDILAGWAVSLAWVSVVTGIIYTHSYHRKRTAASTVVVNPVR